MRATYIEDFQEWQEGFKFSAKLTVRFSDLDLYGIVNNAVTISFLEYARIEYLKHIKLMEDWMDTTYPTAPVIADVQCDYVKPIVYDNEIEIFVKVHHIGNSSLDLHYLGKNEQDEIVFTARTMLVQIEKSTGKGYPWTTTEKEVFSHS